MSKRIDQLTALNNNEVRQDSRLFAMGDPSTGQLFKATMAQLKEALQIQKYYVVIPPGDAGTPLYAPAALTDVNLITIVREGSTLYEVDASPQPEEYTWDGTTVTFGADLVSGERILFLYLNTYNPFF